MTDRRGPTGTGEDRGTGEKMKEKAHAAQDRVSEAASDLKDRGEDLVDEGKELGREMADRAGEAARSRADEEKDRLTGGMRAVARALRSGSDDLGENQRVYGRFLEGVADRVSDASRYLDQRDVNALTRDVRRVARDHTSAFLGGAFVLGVMGARFLKSSPDDARAGGRDEWSGRELAGRELAGRELAGREPLSGDEPVPGGDPLPGRDQPRGLPESSGRPEPGYGRNESLEGGRDARGI